MTAAIYVRVSSSKKAPKPSTEVPALPLKAREENQFLQNPKVQEAPLIALAGSRGWAVEEIYVDRMSGANAERPEYQRLMQDARRGQFQVVLVWRFDRFARSTKELIDALEEFRSIGVSFVSHQEAIDTSTPMGKMMFTMVAAFAEFERDIIRERIIAGLEHARENGTKSGKTIGGQPKVFRRDEVLRLYRSGYSYREIAAWMHIGLATVSRTVSHFLKIERSITSKPTLRDA